MSGWPCTFERGRTTVRHRKLGSPLVLVRVPWVRPELVVEIKYLTWTDEGFWRQVVFEGLLDDKPPREARKRTLRRSQQRRLEWVAVSPLVRNDP